MIDARLRRSLSAVAERDATRLLLLRLCVVWSLGALVALGCVLADSSPLGPPTKTAGALIIGAGCLALVAMLSTRRHAKDLKSSARRVESRFPELEGRLITAIEQRPQDDGRLSYMQSRLIDETCRHAKQTSWTEAIPKATMRKTAGFHSFAALLFVVLVIALARTPQDVQVDEPLSEPMLSANEVLVLPGNAEIERGKAVLISAQFREDEVPAQAQLIVTDSEGSSTLLPMQRSLDDPVFGARLTMVRDSLDYSIEFGGERSEIYRLSVFDFPRLRRADLALEYPAYAQLAPRTIQDTRRVTAPRGTKITLLCHLNVEVEDATLVDEDRGTTIPLSRTDDPRSVRAEITLVETCRLRLHLRDDAGRTNKTPPAFSFRVAPNHRPKFELLSLRDSRVSPLEEMAVKVSLKDDYGMLDYGITTMKGGGSSDDRRLGGDSARQESRTLEHIVDFEALGVVPDDLVSYYFWADDFDPEGERRRTYSDMYFAEVRPFEEIYRQGNAPPGGAQERRQQQEGERGEQGNQARNADDLAQRQKELVNATWTLRRRGNGSETFDDDIDVIRDTQTDLLATADSMLSRLQDERSLNAGRDAVKHMTNAVESLNEARQGDEDAIQESLGHEQAAYQSLLALRAREFQVAQVAQRSSPSASSQGGSQQNRNRQRLEQLELTNSQNRYETQRSAQRRLGEQGTQRSEDRELLDRLKELARRQSDLNEAMKELATELDAVQNEAQREELERRLKRLREEEEQILRDTDEVRDRMERSANAEQRAENRDQLERTRENVRRSAQALAEGNLSQAIDEGTRAERELNELRDDVRERTASQFSDDMRDLRNRARELEERERRLADSMRNPSGRNSRSLREPSGRDELTKGFETQVEELEGLLEDISQTMEAAEDDEPLLAEELYETLAQEREEGLLDSMRDVKELVDEGFLDDVSQAERPVSEGLQQLRERVEGAAERILGDGEEALSRAYEELDTLAQALENEVAQAQPDTPPPSIGEASPRQGQDAPNTEDTPNSDEPRAGNPGENPQNRGNQPSQDDQQARDNQQARDGSPSNNASERRSSPSGRPGDRRSPRSLRDGDPNRLGPVTTPPRGERRSGRPLSPLTGEDFLEWSDRLRDVEEMIDDDELRANAARVRSRARTVRQDLKRHSKRPNWDLVQEHILNPLNELRDRVHEELLRRRNKDAMVPIDRDPVPPSFEEDVRRYYERLGQKAK